MNLHQNGVDGHASFGNRVCQTDSANDTRKGGIIENKARAFHTDIGCPHGDGDVLMVIG